MERGKVMLTAVKVVTSVDELEAVGDRGKGKQKGKDKRKEKFDEGRGKHKEKLKGQSKDFQRRKGVGNEPERKEGLARFSKNENKRKLVKDFEPAINRSKWGMILTHDCDHDEDDRSGCGDWEIEAIKGQVPRGIRKKYADI